jgi:hypothetical protein
MRNEDGVGHAQRAGATTAYALTRRRPEQAVAPARRSTYGGAMRIARRSVVPPLLLALAALASPTMVAGAHAATASPITWGARQPVDTTDGLGSVACPTTSLCVAGSGAVDPTVHADDGTIRIATTSTPQTAGSWTLTDVPVAGPNGGGLVSMSCPAARLCVGVDGYGHVLSSTNPTGGTAAWHVDTYTGAGNHGRRFTSVSCPTVARCVAIDGDGPAVLTTATPASGNWSVSSTSTTWAHVSCTATFCAATSGANVWTTTTPAAGAGSWTRAAVVPSSGGGIAMGTLSGVACLPSGCVVTDSGGAFESSGTWSSSHPLDGAATWTRADNPQMDQITCVQGAVTGLCAAWTRYGAYVDATAAPTGASTDWVTTADVADASVNDHVADVSCPTISVCVAVTTKGAAIVATSGADDGTGGGGGDDHTSIVPPATATPAPGTGGPPVPTVGGSPAPAVLPSSGYPGAGLLGNDVYAVTGNAVSFALNSANDVTGSIAATTAASYATSAAKAKRRPIAVGTARFTLRAHVTEHVHVTLSKAARKLLATKHRLKVRVAITSRTSGGAGAVRVRTFLVTLKQHAAPRSRTGAKP